MVKKESIGWGSEAGLLLHTQVKSAIKIRANMGIKRPKFYLGSYYGL